MLFLSRRVFAAALLMLCFPFAGITRSEAAEPPAAMEMFTSKEANFRVLMPPKPEVEVKRSTSESGFRFLTGMASSESSDSHYFYFLAVIRADIRSDAGKLKTLFDATSDEFANKFIAYNKSVSSVKKVQTTIHRGGLNGTESTYNVTVTTPSKGKQKAKSESAYLRCRVLRDDHSLVVMIYGQNKSPFTEAASRSSKFMDSFELQSLPVELLIRPIQADSTPPPPASAVSAAPATPAPVPPAEPKGSL